MGRRASRDHRWADQPGRLLGHDDPYDLWAKLNWEASQFRALRASEPPLDIDGIVYLLQDACITAVAAVEWLTNAGMRAARAAQRSWDNAAFEHDMLVEVPHLPLARAIANTFKHGMYRDEGWGDAEIRLEILFTTAQLERLRALEGTEDFDGAYADEAADAGIQIGFTRGDARERLDADPFVTGLADGVLRLIDASFGDLDQYFGSSSGA